MKIHQVVFSPTGGTRFVSDCVCKGFGHDTVLTDLCVPEDSVQLPEILEDDIAVIAMPVFVGRVPSLAVNRLGHIVGNNARCVIVAVYGNRAYDDALLEMYDVATCNGFRVIAAISAVAEHSIVRAYGVGRPDSKDRDELFGFGRRILLGMDSSDVLGSHRVPGNRPYRNLNAGPFPTADESCIACGKCAHNCPAGAISEDALRDVNKDLCISCMRCVAICPEHSRGIGAVLPALAERLRPLCSARKGNELIM